MNPKQPDDKDPNKMTEEELLELLEELKKHKKSKNVSVAFGFMMHKNYMIHLVLSLVINLMIGAVIFGLAIGMNMPLAELNVTGFIIAFILLTFVENFVKILLFKYFARAMILSMGLLSVLVLIIIMFAIDLILIEGFHFKAIEDLIVFAFAFSIFRLIVSIYIRKWLYREKIVFFGGKS